MTTFKIEIMETCPDCHGLGSHNHPAWLDYWEKLGDNGREMTHEQDIDWMVAHGWMLTYHNQLPPEEATCGECDGLGTVFRHIPLVEAFPMIQQAVEAQYG